jgi:hypothetical protein
MSQFRASALQTNSQLGQIQKCLQDQLERAKVVNDGKMDYRSSEDECFNKDAGIRFNDSDDTHLMMTYKSFDIVDFRDGFFRVRVKTRLSLSAKFVGEGTSSLNYVWDTKRLVKFFVSWKQAEVINDLECEIANRDTKVKNKEVVRSTYIAHKTRGTEALMTSYEHTLWEKIVKFDRDIAGGYFDAADIDANGCVEMPEYEILFPHTHFLEFQAWELYPQFLLGGVDVKIKASMRGATIGQVPIMTTIAEYEATNGEVVDTDEYFGEDVLKTLAIGQTQDFTQIRSPFMGIISKKTTTGTGADAVDTYTPSIGVIKCTSVDSYGEWHSTVWGFSVGPDVKRNIRQMFGDVQYVPAQAFQLESMDKVGSNESVRKSSTVKTNFVEMLDVMYPFHSDDYTVFKNPCLRNFQVQIDNGINYPEEQITTFDPRLLKMVHNAAEIGPLTLSRDLISSYITPRNKLVGGEFKGTRIANTRWAASDFSIPIDLQRNHNEGAFDGYINPHNLMSVQLQYEPIVQSSGGDGRNTYHDIDYEFGERNLHPAAVQLFICRNAHWEFKRVGSDQNGEPMYSATFITRKLVPDTQIGDGQRGKMESEYPGFSGF